MPEMTIARLAAAGGVGVETVRYYQRRGLLDEPPKAGSVRRYGAADLRRLLFIRRAQSAGFTLEEISELLELDSGHDRPRVRALAAERLAALDSKIAELEAARAALTRLAGACAAGTKGPCPILEAFEARAPSNSESVAKRR
jgi:MerR family mercuric resistance operon transcriptional regulator